MLELKLPSKVTLVKIIEGVLKNEFLRDEIVNWWHLILKKFNCYSGGYIDIPLSARDGYWIFISLSQLTKKFDNDYLIRNKDLEYYLKELKGESNEAKKDNVYTLVQFTGDNDFFINEGYFFERGIFDNSNDVCEQATIVCENFEHVFIRKFLIHRPNTMELVASLNFNKDVMCELMHKLNIDLSCEIFVYHKYDASQYSLIRLDENNNEFKIGLYDNYIHANLLKIHYENKNHKQKYFLTKEHDPIHQSK